MSLDAFRGLTIAGMILVNNPGSWSHVYTPLGHAHWHGWTPTDLIFPFFLFIVGVSMVFSFDRRLERGDARGTLILQVVRRSVVLFALGLIMAGFPDWRLIGPFVLVAAGAWLAFGRVSMVWRLVGTALLAGAVIFLAADFAYFHESQLRVPGVLQRIAVCYFVASLVVLGLGIGGRVAVAVALMVGYWAIIRLVPPPAGYAGVVTGSEGLLHDWIDVKLLGAHLYRERPDPEGILSTIPAIATVLLGVLTGHWLRSARDARDTLIGLFVAAHLAVFVGLWMNYGLPINKKLWTSSYVVFTAGVALHVLALCYWLIDVKRIRAWSWPFVVFGTNAILVFFASGLLARMLTRWTVRAGDHSAVPLKQWVYQTCFASWAAPRLGSLLFACAYVLLWLVLLIPLYRRRIFFRI